MAHPSKSIFRNCGDLPFAMLPNKLLQDSRLSWEERGMLVDLLSRKDDFEVNVSGLAKMSGHGRAKIYKLMERALELGYIRKLEIQGDGRDGGKFDTIVYQVFSLDTETRAKFAAVFDSDTREDSTVYDSDTGPCTKIEHAPCIEIEHKENNKKKNKKPIPPNPPKTGGGLSSISQNGKERRPKRISREDREAAREEQRAADRETTRKVMAAAVAAAKERLAQQAEEKNYGRR